MDEPINESDNSDPSSAMTDQPEAAESIAGEGLKQEIMEVHHHPDLHHRKKHLKEYFLEFLMIFLAVSLGFFAESLREHLSDKGRAESYARSLFEDFKSDTTTLHQLIQFTENKVKYIDSLEGNLRLPRNRYNDSLRYLTVLVTISTFQFDDINGTYEQIKNSGALRFFNQDLVNKLNNFDATASKLKLMEDWENKFLFEKLAPLTQTMFNFKVFEDLRNANPVNHEMYLRNMDNESIDLLVNQGELIKRLRVRQLYQQKILLADANEIIAGLRKEYSLN